MNADLAGRVAIVTGAARNIGRAIVVELARGGANMTINARSSAAEAAPVAARWKALAARRWCNLADVSVGRIFNRTRRGTPVIAFDCIEAIVDAYRASCRRWPPRRARTTESVDSYGSGCSMTIR
jgi:NAD(P)-dependent dehydrogenase (short-subunit alcohol dehydrogenase family)